jgi:hypothetical protein
MGTHLWPIVGIYIDYSPQAAPYPEVSVIRRTLAEAQLERSHKPIDQGDEMPNGDIITYSEDDEWKSKVAGSSRAAHVGGTKAEQTAVGRRMAVDRKVEHEIRNLDGEIGAKNSYGNDPRKSRG